MWLERSRNTEVRPSIRDAVELWNLDSVAVLTGESKVFSLAHIWMLRHHMVGRRVRVIDCAVRFDSIHLVDEIYRQDLGVDQVLCEIYIRRAFTPYQILDALYEVLTNGDGLKEVFYLLAPFKQFFDGDVADDEAAYLLHMLNERLAKIGRQGIPILVVEKAGYQHRAFGAAFHQLRNLGKPLWEVLSTPSPSGFISTLRIHNKEISHGTYHRTLQHSNGNGGATLQQIPKSLEKAGPRAG